MPRRSMKSPEQLKKETRESAAAKEKAKANMYLTGGQARIAAKAPPPNKIDEKDFAVLRAEKAKGRGMGLQDEKVKPGKAMKAKRGRLAGKDLTEKMKNVEKGLINKATGKPTSMDAMRKLKGFKPGESSADFNKRRMELARAKDVAKALGPRGKIALGVGLAGVGAVQYLKSKMKKNKDKKMGGGMMKKYKSGGPVPVEKIKKAFPEASPGKVARMQTMLGDKSAPMKKERLFEGDRGRRKKMMERIKNLAKTTPMGLGIKAGEVAKKIKEKMSKKMGGGMMQRPMGYKSGTSVKVKCKLGRNKPTKMY